MSTARRLKAVSAEIPNDLKVAKAEKQQEQISCNIDRAEDRIFKMYTITE